MFIQQPHNSARSSWAPPQIENTTLWIWCVIFDYSRIYFICVEIYPEFHLEMYLYSVEHLLAMKSELLCWAGVSFSWAFPSAYQNVNMSAPCVQCSQMVWWCLEKDYKAGFDFYLFTYYFICCCLHLNITCWNTEWFQLIFFWLWETRFHWLTCRLCICKMYSVFRSTHQSSVQYKML